jgi:Ca2+-binding RTX toxin-like protein
VSTSGQITVATGAVLDYETTPNYTLNVTGDDGNGGTDTAVITINLNDVAGQTATTTNFSETVNGTSEADTYFTLGGNDTVNGNDGNDYIDGGSGDDKLNGGAGNDTLLGGAGNDTLTGGTGNDTIDGGSGLDVIIGGAGNDILTGGSGADMFRFSFPSEGTDTINDFVRGLDKIEISQSGFGISSVLVTSGDNAVASGSSDQFVYDTTSHVLYFDEDGTGGIGPVALATLNTSVTTLNASDFHLIA